MDQLLRERLSSYVTYRLPAGGMAIWLRLNPEYMIEDLLLNCSLQIVRVDVEQNAFRFGFASLTQIELNQAVEELEKAFKMIELTKS
ncbi:hypothetical protein [Sphingobacterium faecium]|uniref:hypothetical protein n=1 Tax=Sphingobacterium faecium TaxID=34087 RepID=UPI002478BB03|nr:hypothetical protein [Sphingobacterium faecium]WGQ14935.1 hypothetical protein QG727_00695 [Sphingobacterium faecium]